MAEYKTYKKGDTIDVFEISGGKVLATVIIGNTWVSNPTLEAFLAEGWEEYQEPMVFPTIEELVEQKLRERYSINQEFEVQRKRDTDAQAFADYYAYVEECITWANEQPHRED